MYGALYEEAVMADMTLLEYADVLQRRLNREKKPMTLEDYLFARWTL
jgi:hypothetical protein